MSYIYINENKIEIKTDKDTSLKNLQKLVGGYFTFFPVNQNANSDSLVFLVNEEAILKEMEINYLAISAILKLKLHNPNVSGQYHGPVIFGPMIIFTHGQNDIKLMDSNLLKKILSKIKETK